MASDRKTPRCPWCTSERWTSVTVEGRVMAQCALCEAIHTDLGEQIDPVKVDEARREVERLKEELGLADDPQTLHAALAAAERMRDGITGLAAREAAPTMSEHTPMTDAELAEAPSRRDLLVAEERMRYAEEGRARADRQIRVHLDVARAAERERDTLVAELDAVRAELERVKDMRAAEADEYVRQLRALPGWCRACPPGCAECLGPDCECYEHEESATTPPPAATEGGSGE